MRHLKRGCDLSDRWINWILIEFEIADRDTEGWSLKFVTQPLEPDMLRKEFLLELDREFCSRRPVLFRFEEKYVVGRPAPRAGNLRSQMDTVEQRLFKSQAAPRDR